MFEFSCFPFNYESFWPLNEQKDTETWNKNNLPKNLSILNSHSLKFHFITMKMTNVRSMVYIENKMQHLIWFEQVSPFQMPQECWIIVSSLSLAIGYFLWTFFSYMPVAESQEKQVDGMSKLYPFSLH